MDRFNKNRIQSTILHKKNEALESLINFKKEL